MNIIETIQVNLTYPPLQKIDPASETINADIHPNIDNRLAQAAIPAVLASLYKFSKTDEGTAKIIHSTNEEDWLRLIFDGKEGEAVENVAQYAGVTTEVAGSHMENIADEAIRVIKEQTGADEPPEKVKIFMNDQRHTILVYLPPSLGIGDLLNDESIDDQTNKMEGPISDIMHRIENKLSGDGK